MSLIGQIHDSVAEAVGKVTKHFLAEWEGQPRSVDWSNKLAYTCAREASLSAFNVFISAHQLNKLTNLLSLNLTHTCYVIDIIASSE